jgi:hypothetical protein
MGKNRYRAFSGQSSCQNRKIMQVIELALAAGNLRKSLRLKEDKNVMRQPF